MCEEFILEMREETVTVDEGVEDNTQICLTLNITGKGIVQCNLTVLLGTATGTASMPISPSLLLHINVCFLCIIQIC